MKAKEGIPYVIAIIALIIGAFLDYQITDTLYQKVPFIGEFFERIVLIPIQFVVAVALVMLHRKYHHRVFLILAYAAAIYVVRDTLNYWMRTDGLLVWGIILVIALLLVGVSVWLTRRMNQQVFERRIYFFLFMSIVLLSATLITTVLKESWGRIRYREMQDISQFCVWYKPCGIVGSRSFPSGHTTGFTAIICLLQWKNNPFEKPAVWRYVSITVLVLVMPITRMIMGAHFLSDTAMGFMITYSCYLIARHYFRKGGYL